MQSNAKPSDLLQWLGNTAIAFAALASSASATVLAQQPESKHRPGHRVELIDVAYVCKNLPAIRAQATKAEGDLKAVEAEHKQKREALNQAVEHLKTLQAGTADYLSQEEFVANLDLELRMYRDHKHRRPNDSEAKIYRDNYSKIIAAVRDLAKRDNLVLVLRCNREEMGSGQNESRIRCAMKNVVYHSDTIDITNAVLQILEKQADTPQAAVIQNASSGSND